MGNSERYEVSMKGTTVMFRPLGSLFLATTAINPHTTPNIWMPLRNGFFSSYGAAKLLLVRLITTKATLINLVPHDTSYDTVCGRLPTQNLLPGFLQALFLLPRTLSTSLALHRTLCQVSWLELMRQSYSGLCYKWLKTRVGMSK